CRVRMGHDWVSRRHARVRLDRGRVRLRDLGSTNGTLLNDRALPAAEVEARHGDRLQIGPYLFSFDLGTSPDGLIPRDEDILDWLGPGPLDDMEPSSEDATAHDLTTQVEALKVEVIQETLVVTPSDAHLVDDSTLDPLRDRLLALLERPTP